MKLLPPPGPERKRLYVLVVLLTIAGVWFFFFRGDAAPEANPAAGRSTTSNLASGPNAIIGSPQTATRSTTQAAASQVPEPLKLNQIEQVPDEPAAGRNLFRFGVPPPPPRPSPAPTPPPVYTPPPTPTPPPIPPIPVKLCGLGKHPDGKMFATLRDQTGAVFVQLEGDIVDGRYKLLKVGSLDVVMTYLDGTGQRMIRMGCS